MRNPPPAPSAAEEELIRAARAGDRAAFDRLMQRYQSTLYRLMLRACHHPQDAEEVASEAFLRAYEHLRGFEGRSSFVTWLGTIGRRLCSRRRERERPEVELSEASLAAAAPSGGAWGDGDPEAEALRADLRRCVRGAIEQLPEVDREVLRLADIEQHSTREVAAATGLTVPAVKARLHRARRRVRDLLNRELLPGG